MKHDTNSNQNEKKKTNREIIDSYDYLGNAASTTDCTGLIPAALQTQSELDSYNDLYQFEPPYLEKIDTPKNK